MEYTEGQKAHARGENNDMIIKVVQLDGSTKQTTLWDLTECSMK